MEPKDANKWRISMGSPKRINLFMREASKQIGIKSMPGLSA